MKDRIILHCDLNNFFASVSLLTHPEYKDCPVAVCGSKEKRHGIVLAKNEAAKKFGVKTAEAIWEATSKCPQLIILPPDHEKYGIFSKAARRIYERYTDLIEPFGIDECWLDVTGSTFLFGSGEQIAERIKEDIKAELGITASVGVSFNKVFAKLGSDMKKPDAITVISRENFKQKVWRLPANELLFVGKSTYEKLKSAGIFTIGDITLCGDDTLNRLLGKNGVTLKKYALGEDDSPVAPQNEEEVPKSVGRSVTPDHDIEAREEVWKILLSLSEDIASTLAKKQLYATGVQIHTRDVSLKVREFSKQLPGALGSAILIAQSGMTLFDTNYSWEKPLRSVGIRAIGLSASGGSAVQQDLFGNAADNEKIEQIESSVRKVREKFGEDSVKRGRIIKD